MGKLEKVSEHTERGELPGILNDIIDRMNSLDKSLNFVSQKVDVRMEKVEKRCEKLTKRLKEVGWETTRNRSAVSDLNERVTKLEKEDKWQNSINKMTADTTGKLGERIMKLEGNIERMHPDEIVLQTSERVGNHETTDTIYRKSDNQCRSDWAYEPRKFKFSFSDGSVHEFSHYTPVGKLPDGWEWELRHQPVPGGTAVYFVPVNVETESSYK